MADTLNHNIRNCPYCHEPIQSDITFRNLCEQHGLETHGVASTQFSTLHESRLDYSTRTFSRLDNPEPRTPHNCRVLCCHRIGPYPDFVPLPTRVVEWFPISTRSSDEIQNIESWSEQWLCNGCQAIIPLSSIAQPADSHDCSICQNRQTWIFDNTTNRGEWRCRRCDTEWAIRRVQPTIQNEGIVIQQNNDNLRIRLPFQG